MAFAQRLVAWDVCTNLVPLCALHRVCANDSSELVHVQKKNDVFKQSSLIFHRADLSFCHCLFCLHNRILDYQMRRHEQLFVELHIAVLGFNHQISFGTFTRVLYLRTHERDLYFTSVVHHTLSTFYYTFHRQILLLLLTRPGENIIIWDLNHTNK